MRATKNPHGAGFLGDPGANSSTRNYVIGAPSRNRTGKTAKSADFKSAVFTNFTIGAL